MKSWYSRVSDIELKDGSIRTNYVVTFETDNAELKREVEKYLQGIMDKTENSSEFPNNCKDEPQKIIGESFPSYITEDRTTQVLDGWQANPRTSTTAVEDEPQTDCPWK